MHTALQASSPFPRAGTDSQPPSLGGERKRKQERPQSAASGAPSRTTSGSAIGLLEYLRGGSGSGDGGGGGMGQDPGSSSSQPPTGRRGRTQVPEPEDLAGLGEEERRAVLRRRRNRVNAANCRQRKSKKVEDLARVVEELRAENEQLRERLAAQDLRVQQLTEGAVQGSLAPPPATPAAAPVPEPELLSQSPVRLPQHQDAVLRSLAVAAAAQQGPALDVQLALLPEGQQAPFPPLQSTAWPALQATPPTSLPQLPASPFRHAAFLPFAAVGGQSGAAVPGGRNGQALPFGAGNVPPGSDPLLSLYAAGNLPPRSDTPFSPLGAGALRVLQPFPCFEVPVDLTGCPPSFGAWAQLHHQQLQAPVPTPVIKQERAKSMQPAGIAAGSTGWGDIGELERLLSAPAAVDIPAMIPT